MIGDTFQGRLYWHDWLGGREGGGHPRECTGTAEHVGTGWVLMRGPRGRLRLKRLSRSALNAGRLCASNDACANVFRTWLQHDDDARHAKRMRFETARRRHELDREEKAFWAASTHPDDIDPDEIPY